MKTIAILMGGYSGEYEVSIASGQVVYESLQGLEFSLYRVELSPNKWEAISQDGERYPIQMDDFSFTKDQEKIKFDAAFNAIHGHPGEDGPLAGYFDMIGLPYTSSGQFASALTFNKAECNILLQRYGFKVPDSVFLHAESAISESDIIQRVGLPCFVKPCRSGSSLGVSMVNTASELGPAIKTAQKVDHKVLIERMVPGLELACGVSDNKNTIQSLAVTHIKPPGAFFDFESKYNGQSEEFTPADIPADTYERIMRDSEKVYALLELKGLARIDYILDATGDPVLIEVNTVPGFSGESLLPKQAQFAGLSLSELFGDSIRKILP